MLLPATSIVIPARNASETIGATLASAIGQAYPTDRLEIVVVDDGSSDETADEARRVLATSAVRHVVWRNEIPLGPSAARNRGWRESRGDWIQFLDADDLLEADKIGEQARAAVNAPADTAALFSPWGRLVFVDGSWSRHTPRMRPSIGSDPVLDLLRAENFLQLGCLLFSRRWLERSGGFVESYLLIEDVDLLLRLVMDGGVLRPVSADRPLSWYRQRAGSLSRTDERGFLDGCLRNAQLAARYWSERHELTASRADLVADIHFMAARYFAEHDPTEFRALTREIHRLNPGFVPKAPRALRLLASVFGYMRAEQCAVHYRHAKRLLRGSVDPACASPEPGSNA